MRRLRYRLYIRGGEDSTCRVDTWLSPPICYRISAAMYGSADLPRQSKLTCLCQGSGDCAIYAYIENKLMRFYTFRYHIHVKQQNRVTANTGKTGGFVQTFLDIVFRYGLSDVWQ